MLSLLLKIAVFLAMDVLWWLLADRQLRSLRQAQPWRGLLAIFTLAQIAYVVYFMSIIVAGNFSESGPLAWRASAYVWHVLVLPITLLGFAAAWLCSRQKLTVTPSPPPATGPLPSSPTLPQLTRRQALGAAALTLPALATGAISVHAIGRLGQFRIRRLQVPIPSLPADLDGLAIVHLTDLHIGKFLRPGTMERVADAANALPADLVVFAGDLYDMSARQLEPGFDFIRRLDPRHGLVMIEGNHDVMDGADWFEKSLQDAGMPLLLDESRVCHVPGRSTPVQFLGIAWGEIKLGSQIRSRRKDRNKRYRVASDYATGVSLRQVLSQRRADTFPILLAHHPDVFDDAASAGLPLTLAGHTHGGQIMLTDHIGAGPVRFRYWTGLYEKPNSRLVVSNGLGNWFPVRVNAPAEIVHLTLRKA
jgi:predicted MPP superfamily phosphohydrolase